MAQAIPLLFQMFVSFMGLITCVTPKLAMAVATAAYIGSNSSSSPISISDRSALGRDLPPRGLPGHLRVDQVLLPDGEDVIDEPV